ncbi:MAG: aldo/keto reductase [Bacteroidota bacterium]
MEKISCSTVIIGAMRLGEWGAQMTTAELEAFIEGCLELGINDFDHADIYGHYSTEEDFGRVLKGNSSLRTQLQLTTKCGIKMITDRRPNHKIKSYDSTPRHIVQSVEHSLRALQTDYIDILLLHRPDLLIPVHETASCIDRLLKEGKIRAFGLSNHPSSLASLIHDQIPVSTHQVEISTVQLSAFHDGTLDQCQQNGWIPTAWSPLGAHQIFAEQPNERARRILKTSKELAAKHDVTFDQILFAWLAKHPAGIIPVIGTTKIDRVRATKEAMSIKLTHEEWYELYTASIGHEVA